MNSPFEKMSHSMDLFKEQAALSARNSMESAILTESSYHRALYLGQAIAITHMMGWHDVKAPLLVASSALSNRGNHSINRACEEIVKAQNALFDVSDKS